MAFEFNISRDDLLKAISTQQNITSKKGTLAILSNVLLEVGHDNITFTGTDLEIGLKQTVPAEVLSPGTLTLPAKNYSNWRENRDPRLFPLKKRIKIGSKLLLGPAFID